VSLIPLAFIAVFFLLFILKSAREDFMVKIDLLSKSTSGQIQLFLDQPLTSLNTISKILPGSARHSEPVTRLLNMYIQESLYFESIYILDHSGKVINVGLPPDREHYRMDLTGITLGHKKEFKAVVATGQPEWSDTFLSLSSGKISLTLWVPAGSGVVAADINLSTLARLINQLRTDKVITMVIDKNGTVMVHPDMNIVGKQIMVNDIGIVSSALAGKKSLGSFKFSGRSFIGATHIIEPAGWIALISAPATQFTEYLYVPLLIIGGGIFGCVVFSLLLAIFKAKRLARPLINITEKSGRIARGEYSLSLPESSYTELQQLSDSISHMALAIRKREQELREKEITYRELVENTSNLVLRLDRDLAIVYANHTIERFTGRSAPSALGMNFKNILADEDRPLFIKSLASWTKEHISSGTVECRIPAPDSDSDCHLLLTANLHFDASGRLGDISVIGHVITARYQVEKQKKEMEEKRQVSQKMELLGLMAGGVAHDLNNILAGIINYPELLLTKLQPHDPLRRPIEAIKKSGERAAAVVADLLTVARDSASVYKITDLNTLITGYLSTPEFKKLQDLHPNVSFSFHPCADIWACNCSPIHIEKTMMNLITNAFEAVKTDGTVEITTANVDPAGRPPETEADLKSVPCVVFTVKDSGECIPPSDLKRIFEPFFSKKGLGRSGTGLGLTVSWNTIREHGGTITVHNDRNGSLFTVYLPADQDSPKPTVTSVRGKEQQGNGEHILVVDDEEDLREIGVEMLELLGYKSSAVSSGEKALEFLHHTPVDLILLDMQMDPGMNGKETYKEIKKLYPHQKALITTGFSTSDDVEATLLEGAGSFIKKPFGLQDLAKAVDQVLNQDN
jgi:PAS domain S-box-containing protein